MSKVITSQIKRYQGSVTIADPLTLPQAQLIEAGMRPTEGEEGERIWLSTIDEKKLPAVLACVEKWELTNIPEGVTLQTFPASPRSASHKLIDWIFNEIFAVYIGESEVPNE